MKKLKLFLVTLLLMVTLGMNLSFADGLSSLTISQCVVDDNDINVYFDITDENDEQLPVKSENIQFTIKSLTDETLPSVVSSVSKYDKEADGTGYVLLIDVSGSVKNFSDMKTSMLAFFKELNPKDNVAIMTFGDSVSLVQEFTNDKAKLEKAIGELKADENWTKLYTGLISAENYCRGTYSLVSDRRTIVLFSDGYDYNTGGETKMDVITELRRSKAYPIYALQYDPGNDQDKKTMIESLGDIIDMSNGEFVTLAGSTIKECYTKIFKDIESEFVAILGANLEAGKYSIEVRTTTASQGEIYDDIEFSLSQPVTAEIPEATTAPDGEATSETSSTEDSTSVDQATTDSTQVDATAQDANKEASETKEMNITNLILLIVMGVFTLFIIILIIVLIISRKHHVTKQPITLSRGTETKAITLKPFHSNAFNPIVHNLGGHTVLGKNAKKADIVIDFDPQVLDEHLILSVMNGYIYISKAVPQADLFINGLPVDSKRELRTGDIISFSDIEMAITF